MGVILLTDQHDRTLLALKRLNQSNLVPVGSPAPIAMPAGLTPDGQGNLIVADRVNDRLVIRDLWSGAWQSFGSRGAGQGQFFAPAAVAADAQSRVYVADAGNHRVVRMDDLSGSGWTTFGTAGKPTKADPVAEGMFAEPRGIAIDGLGRILVTDPGAGRAVRFDDMAGAGWAELPLPFGPAPNQPFGIAAGGGQVAITDVGNSLVHVFDIDDNLLVTLAGAAEGIPVPAFVAFDDAALVVADIVSNELRRYLLRSSTLVLEEKLRGSGPELITSLFQQIGGIASGGR